MTERFTGKVAIVTGGGDGIGAATAMRFAKEGAAVILADKEVNAHASAACTSLSMSCMIIFPIVIRTARLASASTACQ